MVNKIFQKLVVFVGLFSAASIGFLDITTAQNPSFLVSSLAPFFTLFLPTLSIIIIAIFNNEEFSKFGANGVLKAFGEVPLMTIVFSGIAFVVGYIAAYLLQFFLNITYVPIVGSTAFDFMYNVESYWGGAVMFVGFTAYFVISARASLEVLFEHRDDGKYFKFPAEHHGKIRFVWAPFFKDVVLFLIVGASLVSILYINIAHYFPEESENSDNIIGFSLFTLLLSLQVALGFAAVRSVFSGADSPLSRV